MEPLFVNSYTATHRMVAEFNRKYAVGPRYRNFIFLPFILLIAYFYFSAGHPVMGSIWCCLTLVYLFPHYYTWAAMRNTKRLNNGVVPPVTIRFGDEAIEMEQGVTQFAVPYESITGVVRLKHSYMLMTSKRTGMMLSEDGFRKGSMKAFQKFLRKKRPDLTIPE